jgi:hypothetical protein
MIARLASAATRDAAPRVLHDTARAKGRRGSSTSSQLAWEMDTASMERMAVAFQ